jgi:NADH dehydrogenase [ubiquinone] 1 alpha subcomplex assembly factor 1
VKYSGYCAIRSPPYKNALGQLELFDLSEYDGLEFRVRGDGRKFTVNVQTEDYIKEDLYQAFLITRGGPFWEEIQLSFDSFILTNRGYVQDFHIKFAPQNVRTIGVLLADRTNGPFRLEIDYIKAVEMPSLRVKSEPGQWSRMVVPHS